jgi:hypothetical protein
MSRYAPQQAVLWAVLSACALTGCSQTASFRQLRSAQVDTSLHRLAIVNVAGNHEASGEAGAALWDGLEQSGCYELVSEDQLQPWSRGPLRHQNQNPNVPAIVDAARHAGADGVLITRIRFVESDGSIYGSKAARFGDPRVAAGMTYVLIDTRSSSVVSDNTVKSEYYQGELSGGRGPRSEFAVFSELAREAGGIAARQLAPHETDVQVTLARGGGDVREGIQAARKGDWQQARRHWFAAVDADPKNHAALYNLGLALEATGDLSGARDCYEKALTLNNKGTYQRSLDRLESTAADVRLAWTQKHRAAAYFAAAHAPHHRFQPVAHPVAQPEPHPVGHSRAYPATRSTQYDPREASVDDPSTWLTNPTW